MQELASASKSTAVSIQTGLNLSDDPRVEQTAVGHLVSNFLREEKNTDMADVHGWKHNRSEAPANGGITPGFHVNLILSD